ncbi:MAG TPA: cytochrome c3 family protein [Pyrinomonadaceae bacterium]|nr:cytochrome c3 family protein [Pyrinomonadaceae bacterium]
MKFRIADKLRRSGMFIEDNDNNQDKLRRSEIFPAVRKGTNIPLLRSLSIRVRSACYKYFLPSGLVPLGIITVICTLAVINSHAHLRPAEPAGPTELQTPQEQMQFPEGLDYSKFQHSTRNHARLPCLLCHRRESNAPVPGRPGASKHLPCAGCHAQQFTNTDSPLCTICHTDVKSGALKPFPRLKSFRMKFDHALHVNMGSVSCASCHRPLRGGVALSIPAGFNAHTTCYRCHTSRAQSGGRDISSCGTCHQLGGYSRTPTSAQAFRVGFSHDKHEKTSCSECHQIRAGMPQRRQVTQPEPLNHHATGRGQSCLTCHDGKRAFGDDDFSVCKRCHTGTEWRFGK